MAILLHDIVMVRDQHGKSQFLRQADLRHSGDSIVTGQDRIDSVLSRGADNGFIDSIAILDPVRNLIIHVSPDSRERPVKQVRRADAVYIVIPDYPDPFSLLRLLLQDLYCKIHVL